MLSTNLRPFSRQLSTKLSNSWLRKKREHLMVIRIDINVDCEK